MLIFLCYKNDEGILTSLMWWKSLLKKNMPNNNNWKTNLYSLNYCQNDVKKYAIYITTLVSKETKEMELEEKNDLKEEHVSVLLLAIGVE